MNNICSQKTKFLFKCSKFTLEIDKISETMIAFWKSTTTKFDMNVDNVSMKFIVRAENSETTLTFVKFADKFF